MADLITLDLLTQDSVEELRSKLKTNEAGLLWDLTWDDLVKTFSLKTFASTYALDPAVHLKVAADDERNRDMDAENSKRILQALPHLSAADATDERLWVTLALRDFRSYLHGRWPRKNVPVGNHLRNHAFAGDSRTRDRDHAISRLWWTAKYAVRMTPSTADDTLALLFHNSDLIVQFIQGRTNLSSIPALARAILKLAGGFLDPQSDAKWNRENWRNFMTEVDFLAGRQALGILTEEELISELRPIFDRHLAGAAVV